ncbi:MAG: 23S rRNA pseudouridine(955/2504/2580) synthase RluC [Gammaproteobacteria bacterium]|nr:MAG: 23S rRNA pseudouridine(955/2504/2580) synthase RluC [Gammaproteobacteria bacterium]
MKFCVKRLICGSESRLTLVESAAMENAEKPAVRWLDISAEEAGQRIDNFLLRILKGVPRSRIYRLLRKGEVRVNKGRIRPEYRLQSGDQVRIPPVRVAAPGTANPAAQSLAMLADAVLYEDDRLLVLNKPAGMAVHGGSGLSYGVIEALRALRPNAPYLELVHRLDRATSGCLMIAKRRSELRMLHELLRGGGIEKRYLMLVLGDWSQGPFRIDAALRKNQLRGGERIVRVDPEGKVALTQFRFLEAYPGASLMEAELKTGRTHQIRVHAAHAGHPLAGDEKYGAEEFNRQMRSLGLTRMFLHAHYLAFEDSERGRSIEVSAPLGADLRKLVQLLEIAPDTGHDTT